MMKRAFILICISLSFVLFFASGSLFSAVNEPGDDLLRLDQDGKNLGNLEMPRRPVIITAGEEMGRLMVIDEPEVEVPRNWLAVYPDQPRGIDWHVRAYDGIDSIRSDETFSIVIAPLSVGDGDALLPVELALGPVFPNPFNDVITISYAIPRQTVMSLSIIDPLGRRIRTLEHGGISAGRYVTHWDGVNQNGMKVSSGMYICLLTTPDRVLLQRIVLLR